jgi:hypothetical protein
MSGAAGAGLTAKIENPLKFKWGTGGAGIPPTIIHGFDVTLLIDLSRSMGNGDSHHPTASAEGSREIVVRHRHFPGAPADEKNR